MSTFGFKLCGFIFTASVSTSWCNLSEHYPYPPPLTLCSLQGWLFLHIFWTQWLSRARGICFWGPFWFLCSQLYQSRATRLLPCHLCQRRGSTCPSKVRYIRTWSGGIPPCETAFIELHTVRSERIKTIGTPHYNREHSAFHTDCANSYESAIVRLRLI